MTPINFYSFPTHCQQSRGSTWAGVSVQKPHLLHVLPCGLPAPSCSFFKHSFHQEAFLPLPEPPLHHCFLLAHTHFPFFILANIYWAPILCQTLHPQPALSDESPLMNQTSKGFELPGLHSLEGETVTDASSHTVACQVLEHTRGTGPREVRRGGGR